MRCVMGSIEPLTATLVTTVSPVYLVFAGTIVAQAYRQLRAENRDDEDMENRQFPRSGTIRRCSSYR